MIMEHEFPTLSPIIADALDKHIRHMKKLAYYEGRIALLKRLKGSGIPPNNNNSLGSLNMNDLYKEHLERGPIIETKFKVGNDTSSHLSNDISMMTEQKVTFTENLKESRTLLQCMLTSESFQLVIDILDRTFNNIRNNVGKSNDNLYKNFKSSFELNKLVEYRWRSLLKDVSEKKKEVTMSKRFKEMLDSTIAKEKDLSAQSASASSSLYFLPASFPPASFPPASSSVLPETLDQSNRTERFKKVESTASFPTTSFPPTSFLPASSSVLPETLDQSNRTERVKRVESVVIQSGQIDRPESVGSRFGQVKSVITSSGKKRDVLGDIKNENNLKK